MNDDGPLCFVPSSWGLRTSISHWFREFWLLGRGIVPGGVEEKVVYLIRKIIVPSVEEGVTHSHTKCNLFHGTPANISVDDAKTERSRCRQFHGSTELESTMNYNDHLPPHFHAEYQDYEVTVEIVNGNITGKMPRRALRMIWNWLDEHKAELEENWTRARNRQVLLDIAPLE